MPDVYTKIVDRIYYLGDGMSINMNVILVSTNNDVVRSYYNEYKYYSSAVKGQAITIKRDFNYYVTMDKFSKDGNKISVMIRISDMINFIDRISNATEWFRQKNLFATRSDGKLALVGKFNPIIIDHLVGDGSIKLEPTVVSISDKYTSGIRVTLNGEDSSDITIDNYMGFAYVVNKLDPFASAQTMVGAFSMEKGTNQHSFDTGKMDLPEPEPIIKNGRVISSKKSFFE